MRSVLTAALLVLTGCGSNTANRPSDFRIVYYLHGKVVEDLGPRGVSPRYGQYDYPGIVTALSGPGRVVVSEVRMQDTDVSQYADRVVSEIAARLQSGTSPHQITVVGASKGAVIAALVSTRLREPRMRYVLLANCNDWLMREMRPRLTGEVLSIYDSSDEIGKTCGPLAHSSPDIAAFEEIRLETGLGHGMVYRPLPEWVGPTIAWVSR